MTGTANRNAFGISWTPANEDYVRRAQERDITCPHHGVRFRGPNKRWAESLWNDRTTGAPVLLVVSDSHGIEPARYYRPRRV